ncbi:MAG: DUF6062 family protein [Candidatus Limnocylindria bacterium]
MRTAPPGGLTLLDLLAGMERAGCPLCRSQLIAEERYLRSLLHEQVNDPGTRAILLEALGFCPRHTWLLGRVEERMFHDRAGTSILLRAFLREWRRRIRELPPATPRRRSRAPRPGERCRACVAVSEFQALQLETLVDRIDAGDERLRGEYERSDGLCLGHLAVLIEEVPDSPARAAILDRSVRDAELLEAELDEYDRKRAWASRDEPKGREQSAWRRASLLFAGIFTELAAEERDARDDGR